MEIAKVLRKLDLEGYCILQNAIPLDSIDYLTSKIDKYLSQRFLVEHSIVSSRLAEMFSTDPGLVTNIYDALQKEALHFDLYRNSPNLLGVLKHVYSQPIVYSKAPLRIDVPYHAYEMTSWHQDFFHCQGSPKFLSAYVPLRDINYLDGALSVIPLSHGLGVLEHIHWGDTSGEYDWTGGNKRRFCPTAVNFPSVVIELKKGDILLFNALLLHSTNINLGKFVNFNINYRFSSLELPHNPMMLDPVQVE